MNSQLANYLLSLTGLGLLAAVWFFLWRPYTVARLRHALFEIRDDLFDQAAAGANGLSFDSSFYRMMREELNLLLRYCHRASLVRAFMQLRLEKVFGVQRIEVPVLPLTAEQVKIVQRVKERQRVAIIRYLLQSSPFIWLWLLFYMLGSVRKWAPALISRKWASFRASVRSVLALGAVSRLEHAAGQRILAEECLGSLCPA
jgi:hypothetical protein